MSGGLMGVELPTQPGTYGPFILEDDGRWSEIMTTPVSRDFVARNWKPNYQWEETR